MADQRPREVERAEARRRSKDAAHGSDRKRAKVVVVGGGAAGLAAAYALRKQGVDATVFEAAGHAGGRMHGHVFDGFHVDTGACMFHEAQTMVHRFSRELGVPFDRSPRFRAWTMRRGGRAFHLTSPHRSLANLRTFLSFQLFSWRELRQMARFVRMLRRLRSDLQANDHTKALHLDTGESFAEFARRVAGDAFATGNFMQSFLSVAAICPPERMGALQAVMMLWESTVGYPQLSMRNPERCVTSFSRAVVEACADYTRLATPVRRIVIEDGRARGIVTDDGFVAADAVICATTSSAALRLMPNAPDRIRDALARVEYSSCCHVAFGVDGHPLSSPSNVFSFAPRSESFIGIYFDSTVSSPLAAPPGKGIVHAYANEEHSDELFALSDDEVKRRFIAELRRHEPEMPEEPLFTRVHRWREAVYLAPGGVMTELHALRQEGFPGVARLALAGEYMRMAGVGQAMTSGIEAADAVMRELGAEPG